MRSTLKTITFATIALSLAAGGAFAAGKPHQIIRSDSDHGDDMSISRPMPEADFLSWMRQYNSENISSVIRV